MQKDVSASKADSFLPRISRQGRNYSTLVGWLLYRAFNRNTWKLAVATALSLLHLSTQGAAIYLVYWYGRAMQNSGVGKIPLLGIEMNLKDHPKFLWAIVAISTACFVVSAVLLYLSRKQILDIVEKYYARSLEQVGLLSLRVPDPRARVATQIFMDHGVGGLTMGCRRGTLTSTTFASAITAVLGGLGGAVFLVRIDLPLTLLIIVSALFAALFLYPLTIRATRIAKAGEKVSLEWRAEMRQLNQNPTVDPTVTTLGTADKMARAYMSRRRLVTELVFATEIGITILLGMVIYYMASQALAGKEQWAIFIAYIGALRMTLNGGAQAIRAFASVSRFYPQIVRYYLFVKDMQKIDATPLAKVRRGDSLILGTLPNGRDVVAEAGDHLALLATGQLREPMFALVGAKLVHSGEPVAAAIVDPANPRENGAGLALIASNKLGKDRELPILLTDVLSCKVTFIVYHQAENAGSFGEKHVLTAENRELRRFAVLGTEEGDAVLKEFQLKASSEYERNKGLADDDEDDDDM